MNKKLIAILSAFSLCVSMTACSNKSDDVSKESTSSSTNVTTLLSKLSEKVETIGDIDTYIKLSDNNTTVDGSGVKVDGNIITINTAGTYSISGKLSDGQIIVNTDKEKKIYILLDGLDANGNFTMTGGSYTKGTEAGSCTISDTITNVNQSGASSNNNQPGGGGGGNRGENMIPPSRNNSTNTESYGNNSSSGESI